MCKQRVIIIRYLAVRLLPFDFDFGLIYVSILFYPAVRSTFFLFFSFLFSFEFERIESNRRDYSGERERYIYIIIVPPRSRNEGEDKIEGRG